jgi:hypothetical protein
MDTSKRILILIFVSMGITCFSEDIPLEETDWDSQCFECFHKGADLLLLNESQGALEYFEKGHQLAAQSQSDAVILDFCLYFSETVILDMFGHKEQCAQSLSSLIHVLEVIENSEEEDDSEEYTSNSYEQIDFAEMQSSQDLTIKMRRFAGMAPTPEVRAVLFYIIERFGEEMLPEFQFADPFYLQQEDWTFGTSGNDEYSLDLCKKHKKHKKHEDWFDKTEKWIGRVIKVYKLYQEIKKCFD